MIRSSLRGHTGVTNLGEITYEKNVRSISEVRISDFNNFDNNRAEKEIVLFYDATIAPPSLGDHGFHRRPLGGQQTLCLFGH